MNGSDGARRSERKRPQSVAVAVERLPPPHGSHRPGRVPAQRRPRV